MTSGAPPIIVADSVTKLPAPGLDAVVLAASHAGVYAAAVAALEQPRGVILNDAGFGLDEAGVAGLAWLDAIGCPACAVSTASARIGWGADMLPLGIVSRANDHAALLGCRPGQSCAAATALLQAAPPWRGVVPEIREARMLLRTGPVPVVGIDSNSLVQASDADAIVVTGSHGGLLGGRPETAIRVLPLGALYHDAGGGRDGAGMSRLPALDARGVPAATVAADSARIGDARSVWATGRLSAVNALAAGLGIRIGMSAVEFADEITRGQVAKASSSPA